MVLERDGRQYVVAEGHDWFWKVFANKTWEPNTFKVFDRFLDKEKTFVDIGAWIGPTVLYAAPKAKEVFAFEPDPVAFRSLAQNLALNAATNVVPYRVAVAAKWGGINFGKKIELGDSMSSVLWAKKGGEQVAAVSLEAVILDLQPNFIKIDIEGGEKTIFDKAILAMAECKPTIHLSLHTPWFKDDLESYKKSIMESLEAYPYFYNENLQPVLLGGVFNPEVFNSVVASYIKL